MKYNDNELVYYVKEGNTDDAKLLYEKYYPYIKSYTTKTLMKHKNLGLEESDINQEGLVALMEAIESYDEEKDNKFFTYAKTCIENQITQTIIKATREKNKIMNESLPITNETVNLFKTKSSYETIIECEDEKTLLYKIKNILTNIEDQILQLKLCGTTNAEISILLEIEPKAINNAMFRIRKKLKKLLNK